MMISQFIYKTRCNHISSRLIPSADLFVVAYSHQQMSEFSNNSLISMALASKVIQLELISVNNVDNYVHTIAGGNVAKQGGYKDEVD